MQYRIRIFSDDCDSSVCKRIVEMNAIISELDYGEDKSLFITDGEDYTYVIIWNTAMPKLRCDIPKENVIGFACEPLIYLGLTQQFITYAQKHIQKYYIGDINYPDLSSRPSSPACPRLERDRPGPIRIRTPASFRRESSCSTN